MPKVLNPARDLPDVPWKPQTFYAVRVSLFNGNPWHRAILYTGFLSNGIPCGYAQLYNPTYEIPIDLHSHNYRNISIQVIEEIASLKED